MKSMQQSSASRKTRGRTPTKGSVKDPSLAPSEILLWKQRYAKMKKERDGLRRELVEQKAASDRYLRSIYEYTFGDAEDFDPHKETLFAMTENQQSFGDLIEELRAEILGDDNTKPHTTTKRGKKK